MIIRFIYKTVGGHVHCRVFTAPAKGRTFSGSGDLVFRVEEWDAVRYALPTVEFVSEAP